MSASRLVPLFAILLASLAGVGCQEKLSPAQEAQLARIKTEPRGDYYIGRRYYVKKTRFWGYLRRPGQSWETARLAIMNEDVQRQPDRLPETTDGSHGYGFDHNYEYKIKGRYTGDTSYDPNSNMVLPEFRLESYELISEDPGFLFSPDDKYDSTKLPKRR